MYLASTTSFCLNFGSDIHVEWDVVELYSNTHT